MSMKRIGRILATAAAVWGLGAGTASAQTPDTATATVTYEVSAVVSVSIANTNVELIITDAAEDGTLEPATAETTYAITNNDGTKKIVGRIGSAMPANTTLSVSLDAPGSGTSEGDVVLTTTDQDLVTGIGNVSATETPMTFKLSATIAAGQVSGSRTFTMTVVGGA